MLLKKLPSLKPGNDERLKASSDEAVNYEASNDDADADDLVDGLKVDDDDYDEEPPAQAKAPGPLYTTRYSHSARIS